MQEILRDVGLIPRSGRSPGGEHGNPLQYSGLEKSTGRGAWQAIVPGVTKNQTRICIFLLGKMPFYVCLFIFVCYFLPISPLA